MQPHCASPPPLQSATKEHGFQTVKQFFPTGASGPLARCCAAQESCPGLPHGWACDGQAKLLQPPSPSAPSTRYPASVCTGGPPQHHCARELRWGKAKGCLLSSISNLFCIHLHAGHGAIHVMDPICELKIICQPSWWLCVSVCGGNSKILDYAI